MEDGNEGGRDDVDNEDDSNVITARRSSKRGRCWSDATNPDEEQEKRVLDDKSVFSLTALRVQWMEKAEYQKVGRLELALEGIRAEEHRITVNEILREHGCQIFSSQEWDNIAKIEASKLTRYSYNFDILKDEIRRQTPEWQLFKLKDQSLLSFWSESVRWTNGGDFCSNYCLTWMVPYLTIYIISNAISSSYIQMDYSKAGAI